MLPSRSAEMSLAEGPSATNSRAMPNDVREVHLQLVRNVHSKRHITAERDGYII